MGGKSGGFSDHGIQRLMGTHDRVSGSGEKVVGRDLRSLRMCFARDTTIPYDRAPVYDNHARVGPNEVLFVYSSPRVIGIGIGHWGGTLEKRSSSTRPWGHDQRKESDPTQSCAIDLRLSL